MSLTTFHFDAQSGKHSILRLLITSATLLFFQNLSAQDLQNRLIGCYSFSGNADDGSGHNRNGTVVGATLASDRFGNPNSAYQCGLDAYILLPRDSVPILFWSYAAWVKFISVPAIPLSGETLVVSIVYSGFSGLFFSAYQNQETSFLVEYYDSGPFYNGAGTLPANAPLNEWVHLVAIGNDGDMQLYVNGIFQTGGGLLPTGKAQRYQQQEIAIGSNYSGSAAFNFTNIIDDVALYDLSSLRFNGISSKHSNLIFLNSIRFI